MAEALRYIVLDSKRGVYLGGAGTLDLWSSINPLGEMSAPPLSREDAERLLDRALTAGDACTIIPVTPDQPDGRVSMSACVAAGAAPWNPTTGAPAIPSTDVDPGRLAAGVASLVRARAERIRPSILGSALDVPTSAALDREALRRYVRDTTWAVLTADVRAVGAVCGRVLPILRRVGDDLSGTPNEEEGKRYLIGRINEVAQTLVPVAAVAAGAVNPLVGAGLEVAGKICDAADVTTGMIDFFQYAGRMAKDVWLLKARERLSDDVAEVADCLGGVLEPFLKHTQGFSKERDGVLADIAAYRAADARARAMEEVAADPDRIVSAVIGDTLSSLAADLAMDEKSRALGNPERRSAPIAVALQAIVQRVLPDRPATEAPTSAPSNFETSEVKGVLSRISGWRHMLQVHHGYVAQAPEAQARPG